MMTKAFDSALDLVPEAKAGKGGLWSKLLASLASISEGIRLASDYKALTGRGIAPDVAVRKVFETIRR